MTIVNVYENYMKYKIAEVKFCDDISNNKLTFYEALARCHELWDLIPNDCDVNNVRLNNLMKEKFGELDEYKKHYSKTFVIDIGTLKDFDVEAYIKQLTEKFKRPIMNIDLGNPSLDEDYFIPISSTIDEQLIDMEKFNSIMADVKQDNAVKRHAIEFAEWLWRNAIEYQESIDSYTFREVDDKVNSYTIKELYDKYLTKPINNGIVDKTTLIEKLKNNT